MREMGSAVGLVQVADEVGLAQVTEDQHVEQPVVRNGVGAELHTAGLVAPDRRDHLVHLALALLIIDAQAYDAVTPAREDRNYGQGVAAARTEALRPVVHAAGDRAADAGAGSVGEVLL